MSIEELRLTLAAAGRADLSERGEPKSDDTWGVIDILDEVEVERMDFDVTVDEVGDTVTVHMGAHHIETGTGERAFHMRLDAELSWADVRTLHSFLSLLIAQKLEER